MKTKFQNWVHWARQRPVVLINLSLIAVGLGFFAYLLVQPIDVLDDWNIHTTKQAVNGVLPEYSPGGTLEYISSSNKLRSARGTITRTFNCDAIPGGAGTRDIRLATSPGTRAPGISEPTEISVVVPAIVEFNGLPRTCRLVIDVCYDDVILWRDKCETTRSNDFLVREGTIDPVAIREEIEVLKARLAEIDAKAATVPPSSTAPTQQRTTTNSQSTNNTTTNNSTTNNTTTPEVPADSGFQLNDLPLVGPLLGGLGL